MNNHAGGSPGDLRPFIVGTWHVVPATGQVYSGDEEVRLEPKAMDVLVYLAQHAGQPVTRMDLEGTVWSGTIVSYDALTVVINKIRKALHDDSRKPEYIETLAKKGYRLIASVSWEDATSEKFNIPSPLSAGLATSKSNAASSKYYLVFILLALLAGGFLLISGPTAPVDNESVIAITENTASIAVLPFINASGDPAQDYFASGMTEYLITDLSKLSNLFVIARSSVRNYKSDSVNMQDVSKELGVRYVITGSIWKNKDKIRVIAHLIDTTNNILVWADRFDRKLDDVVAVQDELTQTIVSKLAIKLTNQEKELLNRPINKNFAAYELVLEGQKEFFQHTKESIKTAQEIYKQAINIDSENARAYSALSVAMSRQVQRNWADSPQVVLDRAKELAQKAIKLDDSLPQAYWALSFAHMYRQEFEDAIRVMKQGITIAPSYADGYGLLALIYNNLGKPEPAIELIKKGMKLNPYYTFDYPYNLGRAYYANGRIKEAIPLLQEVLQRNENAVDPRLFLAASYVQNGQIDDAQWEIEQIQVLAPELTLNVVAKLFSMMDQKLADVYLADLRQAGLPE
jgi:TolB-like protein/DNA-binding winged helix-turn-helix (wHTH) protein/Tfp pilus assembly protein PilF